VQLPCRFAISGVRESFLVVSDFLTAPVSVSRNSFALNYRRRERTTQATKKCKLFFQMLNSFCFDFQSSIHCHIWQRPQLGLTTRYLNPPHSSHFMDSHLFSRRPCYLLSNIFLSLSTAIVHLTFPTTKHLLSISLLGQKLHIEERQTQDHSLHITKSLYFVIFLVKNSHILLNDYKILESIKFSSTKRRILLTALKPLTHIITTYKRTNSQISGVCFTSMSQAATWQTQCQRPEFL